MELQSKSPTGTFFFFFKKHEKPYTGKRRAWNFFQETCQENAYGQVQRQEKRSHKLCVLRLSGNHEAKVIKKHGQWHRDREVDQ